MSNEALKWLRPVSMGVLGVILCMPAYDYFVAIGGYEEYAARYIERPVDGPLPLPAGSMFVAEFAVTRPLAAGRWLIAVDALRREDTARLACALAAAPRRPDCDGVPSLQLTTRLYADAHEVALAKDMLRKGYGHTALLSQFAAQRDVHYKLEVTPLWSGGVPDFNARIIVRTDFTDRGEKGHYAAFADGAVSVLLAVIGLVLLLRSARRCIGASRAGA